jgi:predicted PurR-regulated permease PerM
MQLLLVAVVIVLLFFYMRSMPMRFDGFQNAVKTLPPNVYRNPKSAYSNEDIASLINKLRTELSHHQQELPETIAKAIQNQVEPAIKGVLSRNHYVPQ